MSIYPELENLTQEELSKKWNGSPLDAGEYAAAYYHELAWLIRELGKAGIKFLLKNTDTTDTERFAAVLRMLPPLKSRQAIERLWFPCLDDPRSEIVASAIDGLGKQHSGQVSDKIFALRKHPSPYVRGSVLRYMSQYDPNIASVMLLEALADPDYLVRETAIDELDELGILEALPQIQNLLGDPHPDVRQAAETALENLQELEKDSGRRSYSNIRFAQV